MNVIALVGKSNCGKSETIGIVYQYLLDFGFTQIKSPNYFEVLGNPTIRDFIDILEKNGVKIGVVSAGDYVIGPMSVKNNLSKLEAADCYVAITACTTNNPKAEDQVKLYSNHFFVAKFPVIESQQRISNNAYANQIINKLQEYLTGSI